MSTVLVTGGAGFIGSHVAEHLLEQGHVVVVLDDLSGGFPDNVPPGAQFVQGSILDHKLVDGLFRKHKFEVVYHLAAYAAEGLSHFIRRFNYENNLVGSVNLLDAAVNHGARRIVFTSSIAVYGRNQLPMTEDMTPMPEDPYGISKLAVEQDLKAAHEMFGIEYTIFRPHNVYGERQNVGDRYRNVIGIFMNCIMQDQPLPVFGDGEQTRAFSHISGVAPVIARSGFMAETRNVILNVGADTPCSINRLVDVISRVFGKPLEKKYLPARNEVVHAFSDHGRVRKLFPGVREIGMEEGIARMWEWAAKKGARQSKSFENIEIARNLPESWKPRPAK